MLMTGCGEDSVGKNGRVQSLRGATGKAGSPGYGRRRGVSKGEAELGWLPGPDPV